MSTDRNTVKNTVMVTMISWSSHPSPSPSTASASFAPKMTRIGILISNLRKNYKLLCLHNLKQASPLDISNEVPDYFS
eukprot:scaffold2831_cov249-Ochromonas_danica.AAC.48